MTCFKFLRTLNSVPGMFWTTVTPKPILVGNHLWMPKVLLSFALLSIFCPITLDWSSQYLPLQTNTPAQCQVNLPDLLLWGLLFSSFTCPWVCTGAAWTVSFALLLLPWGTCRPLRWTPGLTFTGGGFCEFMLSTGPVWTACSTMGLLRTGWTEGKPAPGKDPSDPVPLSVCQHYSNPTHCYGETVLSQFTQSLECSSLRAMFKRHIR